MNDQEYQEMLFKILDLSIAEKKAGNIDKSDALMSEYVLLTRLWRNI